METKRNENSNIRNVVKSNKNTYFFVKRLFDLILAMTFLVLLSPFFFGFSNND